MRNLKKFLALVLAMVMAMSLMVTANASGKWENSFKDETITEAFHEAVDVLAGLGVYKGQDGGKFNATASITRAEVAALIYRIATGDVSDDNIKNGLYSHYAHFSDVNPNSWYAGYVGYTSNAEIIKGGSDNKFYPDLKVTGVQALAMILRTIGYDENDEFTGIGWQVRVMQYAQELGILDNLNTTRYNGTLNDYANREVVAELLFQAITKVPRVTWTPALGYNQKENLTGGYYNPTQGQFIFGLYETNVSGRDVWGAPYRQYEWHKNGSFTGSYTTAGVSWLIDYVDPVGHPIYANGSRDAIAICDKSPKPVAEYFTTVHECDVAADLKIDTEKNFVLFVNGTNGDANDDGAIDIDYKIQATDTTTKVGGQGRWTRFFEDGTCVMIDTMLARVTAVTPYKEDANHHVIIPAQLEVTIYDGPNKTNTLAGSTAPNGSTSNRTISKPATSHETWDEYKVGDFILLNAYTDKSARKSSPDRESAAFETNKVVGSKFKMANTVIDSNVSEMLYINQGIYIVDNGNKGIAKVIAGNQSVVSVNTGKHVVDGTSYDDQLCLFLDRAGTTTNTKFNWYFDEHNNIIGIGDYYGTNFGVITGIYAAFGTENNDTNGSVKAVATVRMADDTVKTITIDRFLMSFNKVDNGLPQPADVTTFVNNWVAKDTTDGEAGCSTIAATPLLTADPDNTIELRPVYDTIDHNPLSVDEPNPAFTSTNAGNVGNLYLAPDIPTNTNAHFRVDNPAAPTAPATTDTFGILYNHMFEFVTASDNSVYAVEVAGTIAGNTGIYAGNANGNVFSAQGGKLYKNSAWLTLDVTASPAAAAGDVRLDNNTQIMIRFGNWITSKQIKVYNGVNGLPGDIIIPQYSQVDWADVDGDGRADYVYINVADIPTVVDYALFYFNGGEASWDGSTGTGYAMGRLNGSKEDVRVEFNDLEQYRTVAYSTNTYLGHLFALQITDGVVSDVMVRQATAANTSSKWVNTPYLLMTGDTTGASTIWNNITANTVSPSTAGYNPLVDFGNIGGVDNAGQGNISLSTDAIDTGSWAASAVGKFQLGVPTNVNATNPYSESTAAVYYLDWDKGTNGSTEVSYERVSNGYRVLVKTRNTAGTDGVWDDTVTEYWISPSATIVGVEEWLNTRYNYVTIVYDSNQANAITELYITPVPDVTPSNPSGPNVPSTEAEAGSIDAGPNVAIPGSATALDAGILSGTRNIVLYSPDYMPTGDVDTAGNLRNYYGLRDDVETELMYFPFTAPDGAIATLRITNAATGDLVYSESTGALATPTGPFTGANRCFCVNMRGIANTGFGPGMPMKADVTYNFAITSSTGEVYSSGTFTTGD